MVSSSTSILCHNIHVVNNSSMFRGSEAILITILFSKNVGQGLPKSSTQSMILYNINWRKNYIKTKNLN